MKLLRSLIALIEGDVVQFPDRKGEIERAKTRRTGPRPTKAYYAGLQHGSQGAETSPHLHDNEDYMRGYSDGKKNRKS